MNSKGRMGWHLFLNEIWDPAFKKWKPNSFDGKLKSCQVKGRCLVEGYDEETQKERTWMCCSLGYFQRSLSDWRRKIR